jgi:uncharacterized protein YecE (DUF72 family)
VTRRPVRIGCSGWQYKSWRGTFYPPRLPARRWLEHYATRFDTVEVNATFYFNNDWEVFAPRNAERLRELVARGWAPADPW